MTVSYRAFRTAIHARMGQDDVYITQTRDYYVGAYLPKYPERSDKDEVIIYNHTTDSWRNEAQA